MVHAQFVVVVAMAQFVVAELLVGKQLAAELLVGKHLAAGVLL